MHRSVYHSRDIQAWEQRWFNQQNSAYGLMQQAAWMITQRLIERFDRTMECAPNIAVCCGTGNNAGDGYLIAKYIYQAGYAVDVYGAERGNSESLALAYQEARTCSEQQLHSTTHSLALYTGFEFQKDYDVYIDALFGIGLNRNLAQAWQAVIESINQKKALKIAIDIPSGLEANTGQRLPCAIKADLTYSILGLKAGLFTGQGKEYVGQIEQISLIPKDNELQPIAQLSPSNILLAQRQAHGHKGSYGHVLIVGGHADMGGAVIMAAEAAFSSGAGKVSIVCDAKHHMAILARSPNIMLRDINLLQVHDIVQLLSDVDAVSFGMGLGRDAWAEHHYQQWIVHLSEMNFDLDIVLDADALWFLAKYPIQMNERIYLTPHPGEAATLLDCSVKDIEVDRIQAIAALKDKYAGQWVLKGAGSLILEDQNALWICTAGNAGMGTGGMGDVLSGMIASLKAQLKTDIPLHYIVTLHALAGDLLAENGQRGVQAHQMSNAIYHVVNHSDKNIGKFEV